jgi:hypothetical protein
MQLHLFHLGLDEAVLRQARSQLLDRVTPDREAPFRWGYLLGVDEPPGAEMPAVAQLVEALDDVVVEAMQADTGRRYERSFVKTALGPPPRTSHGADLTGFRLDTRPAIPEDRGLELARVLLNLSPTPYRLRYAATDRFGLAERGISLPRSDDRIVDLPRGVERRTIEIPAYHRGAAFGLRFWASVVPHVGVDTVAGHFLVSYEAATDYDAERP